MSVLLVGKRLEMVRISHKDWQFLNLEKNFDSRKSGDIVRHTVGMDLVWWIVLVGFPNVVLHINCGGWGRLMRTFLLLPQGRNCMNTHEQRHCSLEFCCVGLLWLTHGTEHIPPVSTYCNGLGRPEFIQNGSNWVITLKKAQSCHGVKIPSKVGFSFHSKVNQSCVVAKLLQIHQNLTSTSKSPKLSYKLPERTISSLFPSQ